MHYYISLVVPSINNFSLKLTWQMYHNFFPKVNLWPWKVGQGNWSQNPSDMVMKQHTRFGDSRLNINKVIVQKQIWKVGQGHWSQIQNPSDDYGNEAAYWVNFEDSRLNINKVVVQKQVYHNFSLKWTCDLGSRSRSPISEPIWRLPVMKQYTKFEDPRLNLSCRNEFLIIFH